MLFYCGIDLHAKESVLCIIDTQDKIHFRDKVPNQINHILEVLDSFTSKPKVALEATLNWYWLVDGLQEAGFEVKLAHPFGLQVIKKAKVKTFVSFNYRRVPAVALAQNMVTSGKLGEIRHVRASYLQDWAGDDVPLTRTNLDREEIDSKGSLPFDPVAEGEAARLVVINTCSATISTPMVERDIDDLVEAIIRMMNGPDDFVGPVNIGNPGEFTFTRSGPTDSALFVNFTVGGDADIDAVADCAAARVLTFRSKTRLSIGRVQSARRRSGPCAGSGTAPR